ncbi:hypothetical protein INT44_004180 [Umbelopsis vinacea]|uniref:40S ribosomal protein S15 n=1 Tax=Umbelopsis vinacea TaxID=44442 RepID=A0A8H7UR65_9FUNG|nr:hypothetical protein INT44_004180 [Umbelopsis vinacea]
MAKRLPNVKLPLSTRYGEYAVTSINESEQIKEYSIDMDGWISVSDVSRQPPHLVITNDILFHIATTADITTDNKFQQLTQQPQKRRTFRKFSYRGVDLDQLLDLSSEQFMELVHCRARRRFQRGLKRKPMGLIKKLRAAKKEAVGNEKPTTVKTHLRDMIIVPEMIGSVVAIYNGKVFNQVEIKPEMVGHYLAEFSISYKPVKHGRPGIGATHSSRFVPLK